MISFQKYIPIIEDEDTVLKQPVIHLRDKPPDVPYYLVEIRVLKHERRYTNEGREEVEDD